MMKKSLVIIDGNNMAFRSAAVIKLSNQAGRDVSVPFGVLKSIRFMTGKLKPGKLVVVWDGGRSPVRVKLHLEYKQSKRRLASQRTFNRDEIFEDISSLQHLLTLLGIPQYKFQDTEADDVIAHLALEPERPAVIVSTDKDFLQLVGKYISIFHPIRDVLITKENFSEVVKLGVVVTPRQYLDFHIMVGDRGDNILGVEGIGEKTAIKIIEKFGSVREALKIWASDPQKLPPIARRIDFSVAIRQYKMSSQLINLRRYLKKYPIRLSNNLLDETPFSKFKEFEKLIGSPRYHFMSMLKDFSFWSLPFRKLSIRNKSIRRRD